LVPSPAVPGPRAVQGAKGRDYRVARRAGQTLDLTLELERTRASKRRSIAIAAIEVRRGLEENGCAPHKKNIAIRLNCCYIITL